MQSLPRIAKIGTTAKAIAPCRMHPRKNAAIFCNAMQRKNREEMPLQTPECRRKGEVLAFGSSQSCTASALRKINCTPQNAVAEKAAKNLRGVLRLLSGVCYAFQLRFATASPQNQLQLAECSCRKRCVVGCDVRSGVAPEV